MNPLSSKSENILHKRSRIKKLLIDTHDLTNDPYYKINSIGKIECLLCLTTHHNEFNYIVHKQGHRHQQRCNKRYECPVRKKPVPKYRCYKMQDRCKFMNGGQGREDVGDHGEVHNICREGWQIRINYPDALFQPSFKFLKSEDICGANRGLGAGDFRYLVVVCEGFESIGFRVLNRDIAEVVDFYDSEKGVFYIQFIYK